MRIQTLLWCLVVLGVVVFTVGFVDARYYWGTLPFKLSLLTWLAPAALVLLLLGRIVPQVGRTFQRDLRPRPSK